MYSSKKHFPLTVPFEQNASVVDICRKYGFRLLGSKALKTATSSAPISMQYSFRAACLACQNSDGKWVDVGDKSKLRTHFNAI